MGPDRSQAVACTLAQARGVPHLDAKARQPEMVSILKLFNIIGSRGGLGWAAPEPQGPIDDGWPPAACLKGAAGRVSRLCPLPFALRKCSHVARVWWPGSGPSAPQAHGASRRNGASCTYGCRALMRRGRAG